MTTERAIEAIASLLIGYTWDGETEQALEKAIEVMEESVNDKLLEKHREEFEPNYNFIDEDKNEHRQDS